MLKTFDISLDIQNTPHPNNNYESFSFSINDLNTVGININLKKDDIPLDITGSTARLVIKKPSKLTVIQDCTVEDSESGKLSVILSTQAYNEPGLHQAEVYLYKGSEVLVPGRFSYVSNDAILNDKTVKSKNDWQAINNALISIDESFVQINDKLEQIENADVYTKSEVNTSLGNKADTSYVDGKISGVNAQLADVASQNNYTVIPIYTEGQLTKVEEKDGSVVKVSSTITYNPDGTVNTVTELINGKTTVSTLNYVNGEFSTVTRMVL